MIASDASAIAGASDCLRLLRRAFSPPENTKRYFLLECAEIFAMSGKVYFFAVENVYSCSPAM
ncbi:MAG TPA: hypothetical protein VFB32_06025 [Rudaea sp.]|nr:hypothetical protein [Rudaea sp.]